MIVKRYYWKIIIVMIMVISSASTTNFKSDQLKFSRVKTAYSEKLKIVQEEIAKHNLKLTQIQVQLRVYKTEKIIEVWAKSKDSKYIHIKDFNVCASSGTIGPKRQSGDGQTPEGFYEIDRYNPASNYYLSLGINYPNVNDRKLAHNGNPGGDIFIHGNCVTIGCLPITDEKIKELYIYCLESHNNGNKVKVVIFPERLTDANFKKLQESTKYNSDCKNLWTELKKNYDGWK